MMFAGSTRIFIRTLSSKKSKFTPDVIKQVRRRNEENEILFGPLLTKKPTSKHQKESKITKTAETTSTEERQNKFPEGEDKNAESSASKINTSETTKKESNKNPKNDKNSKSSASKINASETTKKESNKTSKDEKNSKSSVINVSNNNVHHVLPGFSKDESKLPEHERQVLSNILNMPLFGDYNQNSSDLWKNVPLTSVSKVIRDSMSAESLIILKKWEDKMIKELGVEGFQKYKTNLFNNGRQLHSCIENFMKAKEPGEVTSGIEGYWTSLQHVLKDVDNVVATEHKVTNTGLNYKGILDCIATYQGRPCLIDWKTSQKQKTTLSQTFDQPLQLVAYLSAFNNSLRNGAFDNENSMNHEVLRKLGCHKDGKPLENCLLVVSYENGSDAHVHLMNKKTCLKYWPQWTQRVHKYWFDIFMSKYEKSSH